MRHTRRNFNQTLHTTQTLRQRKNPRRLTKAICSRISSLNTKRQHAPSHAIAMLPECNRALRMILETGIIDCENVWRIV